MALACFEIVALPLQLPLLHDSPIKKNSSGTKIHRHVLAFFGSSRWKYKCFWLDFYIDGLKPVCQLGFDCRFDYLAQPLRLGAKWFFAKTQTENGQIRA